MIWYDLIPIKTSLLYENFLIRRAFRSLRAFPVLKNKITNFISLAKNCGLIWHLKSCWHVIRIRATPEEILNARTSNAQTFFPGKINWYLVRFPPISDIQSMNSADNSFGNLDVCAYWNMQQAINARPSIATNDIITQERVIERCVIVSISSSRHNQCISKEPGGQKQPSGPAFGCHCIWQQKKTWKNSRKESCLLWISLKERAGLKRRDWGGGV